MKKHENTGVIAQLELAYLKSIEKRLDGIEKRLGDQDYKIEDLFDNVFRKGNYPNIME